MEKETFIKFEFKEKLNGFELKKGGETIELKSMEDLQELNEIAMYLRGKYFNI